MGLVSRVEEDLERVIALGRLPRDGFLPSEQLLARQLGVSRVTAREALLRLAARGLVVQHPGRRSRVVPLSQAVTLENLSVMLHGEDRAHPERRRLLEGFFALKRETMVELLAACCERASQEELHRLEDACFMLQGNAPWEEQGRWAEREFELLRLAALVADRPGHFLLVQSLERSFWVMARRLLPHLDCKAVRQWSLAAYHALGERDAQALRRELPTLLRVADQRLIDNLAPTPHRDGLPEGSPHLAGRQASVELTA
jgi:DNA-binding FadR family transcriptional regulator